MTVATWRPEPTPSMLLADAVEVRAIVRAAREHLGMDVAFIGKFHEGVRVNRFIECGGNPAPMAEKSETLLEETYCRRIIAGEMPELMPDVSADPKLADLRGRWHRRQQAHHACVLLSRRLEGERARDRGQRAMAARLDAALALGDPAIVFQPIVDLASRASIGYEALSRFAAEPARPVDAWFSDAARLGRGVELEIAAVERALAARTPLDRSAFVLGQPVSNHARR